MKLDTEFTRAQFPAFSEPSLQGQAFFENAGGSYTCQPVIDRLFRFYRERKMQPYYPAKPSTLGGQEMDEARLKLAQMMGVETDELSFGPSTTQNTYVLAQAVGQWMQAGEAIIVTNQDHEANTGPWRRLAERGIEVREWQIDPDTGHLPLEGLSALLDDKVKLVCFPHCSNVVGEINPVADICTMAHAAGAYACVDGVSYTPHGIPNVDQLDADIYLFSAYKTYGPHQGIMAIRREIGYILPNQGHFFNADTLYQRFTPAGPDHAQVAACAGMADYVETLYAHHFNEQASLTRKSAAVHDLMRAQEITLLQPLLDYLSEKNSVRLLGPSDATRKAPTVAIVGQRPGAELSHDLAKIGIMSGDGHFYGMRCMQAQGVDIEHGALRLSFVHYTSKAEIDQLLEALERVL